MGYYSATKKNETMPFAATWMALKNVILSEVNQTEKEKDRMISLMNLQNRNRPDFKRASLWLQGWGKDGGEG